MKEELISFSAAVMAKEKGCELELFTGDYLYEDEHGDTFYCNFEPKDNSKKRFNLRQDVKCSQSLLSRWLREVHGIHVTLTPLLGKKWTWHVTYLNPIQESSPHIFGTEIYDAYETALEAALQTALKLKV